MSLLRRVTRFLIQRPLESTGLVLVAVFSLLIPAFPQHGNLTNLLTQAPPLLLLSAGQTCVLLTRGIDLSQGATVGALSALMGWGLPALGVPGAIVVTLAAAVLIGWTNGLLVTRLSIHPFIATLATMYIIGGLTMFGTGGTPLAIDRCLGFFNALAMATPAGVPASMWLGAALLGALWFVLRRTRLGLFLYAIGSNPEAAEAHQLPSGAVITSGYILSSVFAGCAAILLSARILQGNPHMGEGLLFDAIGGAVVGGVSLGGGIGGVWPAARGALLLLLIQNALYLTDLNSYIRDVAVGLLIVAGIALSRKRRSVA